MKKVCTLFLLLAFGLITKANPYIPLKIKISELYFDEYGNWQLELIYNHYDYQYVIDTVFLFSTTDTVKLSDYISFDSEGIIVVTADSLDTEFYINRFADRIGVYGYMSLVDNSGDYFYDDYFFTMIIFGDLYGAFINYPREGQSISLYNNYYMKDNSPTIGLPNDTIGACGTIRGTIYDVSLEPVSSRTFCLDNRFETNEHGEFSARVYSKPSNFHSIYHIVGEGHPNQRVFITGISYEMEPDSVIELDIYLLDTLEVGINDINISNTPVSVYPNPISKSGTLKVDIDLPVITSNIYVEITDLNGKLIAKKKVNEKSSTITAPDKGGFYILTILLDSKVISTHRIVVDE
ncbi:MAG TPA: T9SS type A sorting domain-containing protein [Salinivirgaceae bacterium]|nr:T9SS type A sorting domain-containing protein [Salinivirgaceae bacterium]HQA75934.1 T9SS type A sorting domain-containing protein [Salinivirgaceae bacterium]